jgi:hypothetical protein
MRRFGVEIEAYGASREQVVTALANAGIPAFLRGYDPDRARNSWRIAYDGSIPSGFEAVSPILCGDDGFAAIRRVCSVLDRLGATVDRRTGLHVHVDAEDLSAADIATIVRRYARFESTIDSWMPRSRRGDSNRYCHSISAALSTPSVHNMLVHHERRMAIHAFPNRYFKINLQSFIRHRTIEFRHHGGTVDADKICHWASFVLDFVAESKRLASAAEVAIQFPAGTKIAHLVALLRRQDGASMDELVHATGWRAQSVRAAITTQVRRRGMVVATRRADRCTRYRITHATSHQGDHVFAGIRPETVAFLQQRIAHFSASPRSTVE